MLIGANRIRISYPNRLCIYTRSYTIRNNPVLRKISATDYISCSRSGNTRQYRPLLSLSVRLGKEGFLIAVCQNLGAGLGIGVRIKAVQLFLLRKSMVFHIVVLIDLICRYIQNGLNGRRKAHGFQKIYRPHDIGLVGFSGIEIGFPNQRLRCKMKDYFRLGPL